ncbi:MAG: hypothetical protein AAFU85_32420, partial [Planctomycetota bacterium]
SIMLAKGFLKPCENSGHATHRFISIKKPGRLHAINPEALQEMTDEQVEKGYRPVLDVSNLTPLTKVAADSNPNLLEALQKTPKGIRTVTDISEMFYQLSLSPAFRKLFRFESAVVGHRWLELVVLCMGYSQSPSLACGYLVGLLAMLNGIAAQRSLTDFIKDLERLERLEQIPTETSKLLRFAYSAFVDDVTVSTPEDLEELERLQLDDSESYFRPPRSDDEKCALLHLRMVERLFIMLRCQNLKLSLSKTQILIEGLPGQSHRWLGLTFDQGVAKIPEETKRTLTTLASPRSQRDSMRCLGLLNWLSIFIPALRVRTAFMSHKLRREAGEWHWSAKDEEQFRKLLHDTSESTLEGLQLLFDVTKAERRSLHLITDWSKERNCGSAIVLVRAKIAGEYVTKVAACDSRQLPVSFQNKGSTLGEFAAVAAAMVALKACLLCSPFLLWTDSLSLIHLLARRFDTKS